LNEKPPKGAKYCITSEGWKLCQTSKMTGNSKMPVRSLSENIYDVGHQHLNTNSQVMDLSHNNINSGNKNIADHNPGNMNTLMQ